MRWVDLTQPLISGMPVYPGDPPVEVLPWRTVAADGYGVSSLRLGTHAGTHVDAPAHLFPDGRGVGSYPPAAFAGVASVADVADLPAGAAITWGRLREALRAAAAPAEPDIVLVRTGWDRFWGTPRYLEHPYLSREAAVALAGMGCRLVGVDAPSVDPPGADLAAHIALLSAGVLIAENLVLAGLAGCRECVWCVVAPLRLEGGDGAPARAMALLGADRP